MSNFSARPLAAADAELGATVQRRSRTRAEISKLSQGVVNDTRRIDQLLAERSAATTPHVPDSPADLARAPSDRR